MLACKKRLKRKYIILCSKKSNITRYLHFLLIPSESRASLKIWLHRNDNPFGDCAKSTVNTVADEAGMRMFLFFFTEWWIAIIPNWGVLGGFRSFLIFCLVWRKGGLEPLRSSPWNSSESSLAKRPRKPSTTEAARDKGLRAPQRGFGVIIFT